MDHHKPALFSGHEFAAFEGASDPAEVSALAHESAALLLAHAKGAPPLEIERVLDLADEAGLDALAELWSHVGPHSLPGSLWQTYLLRAVINQRADEMSIFYRVGSETLHTLDHVVAGAPTPLGPDEVRELVDNILRGGFTGDFGHALERLSSFCRVVAAGSLEQAHDADIVSPERASQLTTQASRLTTMATQLGECARLWASGSLH